MGSRKGQKANARGANNDRMKIRTSGCSTAVVPAWGGSNGQHNKEKTKTEQRKEESPMTGGSDYLA